MGILDEVWDIAKETPPVDNKLSRFGNPAFKTFYDRVGQVGVCQTELMEGVGEATWGDLAERGDTGGRGVL
jgi:hypothetical protein